MFVRILDAYELLKDPDSRLLIDIRCGLIKEVIEVMNQKRHSYIYQKVRVRMIMYQTVDPL